MKAEPPPDRRKFAHAWDEIGYLHDKLLYWLYHRGNVAKSRHYAARLAPLLSSVTSDHEAIFGEECWSLVYETKGDLPKAIVHRENEIRLIRRLYEISSGTRHEEVALNSYGYADLRDRLDLLAVLYHDSGHLEKALNTLRESRQLCRRHGVKFDAATILREYQHEKRDASRKTKKMPIVAGA
jgi:hypothetical protein